MTNVVPLLQRNEPSECCACGALSAFRSFENQKFPYLDGKDEIVLEARVPIWSCASCGIEFTDGSAEEIRHAAVCTYLGRLNPQQLRAIRERHQCTQDEWADATRLGLASIKRWETGSLIQGAGIDEYLRLLSDPDIFHRVRDRVHRGSKDSTEFVFRTTLDPRLYVEASQFRLRRA